MWKIFSFTSNQRQIIQKCREHHSEAIDKWFLINLIFPIATILIALLFYKVAPIAKQDLRGFLLNGSLSLVGMNVIFSMNSYLLKPAILDNQSVNNDVLAIKEKVSLYGNIVLLIGGSSYVYQIVSPLNSGWDVLFISIVIISILIISIRVGLVMFLIKDDLISEAYDYASDVTNAKEGFINKKDENDNEYQF